ncbi:MAG: hypothetical protein JO164_10190, partial [Candidatus Eremiobacteraeota bacterium]|nr:hypothetical protein [Candidatus Eremiobacteraeota bacterium]
MRRPIRFLGRVLGALPPLLLATAALASASIQVNKQFSPNSVALGGNSTVTVTLQNSSTASAANITSFSDDIGTMSGHATLLTSPAPATTCPGGTPSIAGQVISMNNGQIPQAPSASVPGSCTVTFTVVGAAIGNGFNTIAAANVVTSLGSPSADVTQTLAVQTANVTITPTSSGLVQTGDTATVQFRINNPAAVALTNVAFPVTSNGASTYTVTGFTTSCGGTATLPPSGTSGTANFSGLTVPASGNCIVTLNVTTAAVQNVNFTIAANAITDDQGATDGTGQSAQGRFSNGKPNITKSFNPTAVAQGGTTTLTINVQNVLTDKPLTNAAFTDNLPASLTVAALSANANCGAPTLTGVGTGTVGFSAGTIATNATCTVTVTVSIPAAQPLGVLTNTIPTTSFTSTEVTGSANAASANLQVTGPGGGVSDSKSANPTSAGINTPVQITLKFNSLAGGALSAGTFTDNLPTAPVAMVAMTDA